MPRGYEEAVSTGVTADVDGLVTGRTNLVGYSVRESAGTPARISAKIVMGQDADGSGAKDAVYIELAGNTSDMRWLTAPGIYSSNGFSVLHASGTFDIILYYERIG